MDITGEPKEMVDKLLIQIRTKESAPNKEGKKYKSYYLPLPSALIYDSKFPFKLDDEDEQLLLTIEGKKVIITKFE